MRPIVPINPVAIYVTVVSGSILLVLVVTLLVLRLRGWRPHRVAHAWLLFAALSVLLLSFGAGVGRWVYDANRVPTRAEAEAWIKWAEEEVEKSIKEMDAAVEEATRINREILEEMEQEKRQDQTK